MPDTLLNASSSGSTAAVDISSGLAPGSRIATETVAGSALGKRSTLRSRKEKTPSTTSDMTSIVAKTGRRTHSSEIDTSVSRLRGIDADLQAVGQLLDVGERHPIARLDAGDD